MKILIDARLYGLENTGIGRYSLHLIDELSKMDKSSEYFLLLREKYYKTLSLPKNFHKILAKSRHYSFYEQIEIPKLIRNVNPDISHFLHFNVPVFYKGRYLVTIHDLLMHRQKSRDASTLNPLFYGVKRLGYGAVFKNAVLNAEAIIVPTNVIREELSAFYKIDRKKIEAIYEGVELKKERGKDFKGLRERFPKKYFIYAGNTYPHKNLERVIEAIVFLNKTKFGEDEPVKFVLVVPRGVFRERMKDKIKKYNAEQYIEILGYLEDWELAYCYNNSLAFVYPSFYEGFGLPGLEAIKSGTLALVSDIAVFREVYKNYAIYFNPYDFSAIERAMEGVLTMEDSKRKKMISEGKRYVSKFSWSDTARNTLDLYEKSV